MSWINRTHAQIQPFISEELQHIHEKSRVNGKQVLPILNYTAGSLELWKNSRRIAYGGIGASQLIVSPDPKQKSREDHSTAIVKAEQLLEGKGLAG
jgi:hypothetical protein